eukprot:631840-Amphidinium_carterae.1
MTPTTGRAEHRIASVASLANGPRDQSFDGTSTQCASLLLWLHNVTICVAHMPVARIYGVRVDSSQ